MNIRGRLAEFWDPEDMLDSLWRMVASPYTTIALLAGLATLVCLGILLPQRPVEAVSDPTSNSLWLASLRESYGAAADWLVGLKLVDLHRSTLLRALLGVLAFNLLLGAVDFISPRHVSPLSGEARGRRTLVARPPLAETAGQSLQRVKRVLRGQHYRLCEGNNGDWICADRFAFFAVLVYLGLLLIIGGLALSDRTAWWEEGVTLRPGQVRPVGHGTDLALRAQVSEASYDPVTGQRNEEHTELAFLREGKEVGQRILHNHAPALYAGLLFYPTSTEPALLLQVQDDKGRDLVLQTPETGGTQFTEVVLRFREQESRQYIVVLDPKLGSPLGRQFQEKGNERYVLVPSRGLSLRLLYLPPGPGEVTPTYEVQAFQGGETAPLYQHRVRNSSTVEIAGDFYTLKPQRYAVVKFGQDYGLLLISLGAVAALVGIALSAWRRPRRVCVVAQLADGQVNLHFASPPVQGRAPEWFEEVVQNVATTLALDVRSSP